MASYEEFVKNIATTVGRGDMTAANEILIAYNYGRELESGLYVTGNPDLSDARANERYNNVIKRIIDAKPKEYFVKDFKPFNDNLVWQYCIYILSSIFGSSPEIMECFVDFAKHINVSGSPSPLDGYSYLLKDDSENVYQQVVLPSVDNTSSVVCIMHEFAHYYFQKHKVLYEKSYYKEILSILFEKIASDMLEKDANDPDFAKKMESIRLECIMYHYTTKKEDLKALRQLLLRVPYGENHASKLVSDYTAYSTDLAESYGLGYIYAESLFNLYKTDEKAFQQKMKELFGLETTLQDTLDYYDINLKNKQVFEHAKQRIRDIIKK